MSDKPRFVKVTTYEDEDGEDTVRWIAIKHILGVATDGSLTVVTVSREFADLAGCLHNLMARESALVLADRLNAAASE